MQFKYPELLYALLLLLIPILIHLFQLRRFQKEAFTNVKFLKSVELQTRKSSQLKKWLMLLSRLLLLTCIIIAFAQPFIPNTEDFNDQQETVIYLDNSFSMQAKGVNGTLLNEAIQDILGSYPDTEKLSLFTNNKTFKNTTIKALQNDLIALPFASNQLSYDAAYIKGKQLFETNANTTKNLVIVSDFQQQKEALNFKQDSTINLNLVQLKPNSTRNISIDSVYIANTAAQSLDLNVTLSKLYETTDNITVSLFNNDTLLAKSAVDLNTIATSTFSIPNNSVFKGRLQIDDASLSYDNSLYFNINKKPNIKVLVINEEVEDNFLKRIYTEDEFELTSFNLKDLNFNLIPEQNLIILNELKSISAALSSALKAFRNDGGYICVIPSAASNIDSYNPLLVEFGLPTLSNQNGVNKKITTINYDHPLLKNTFYAKVSNFQYPLIKKTLKLSSNINAVLNYEDNNAFISGINGTYIFASSLGIENSNFKNSQLVVPIFYNMGVQSLPVAQLYYSINTPNRIAISTAMEQDDILSLHYDGTSVIPRQKTYSNSVVIETEEFPTNAGVIEVKNREQQLQSLSFNFKRDESNLSYYNLDKLENLTYNSTLSNAIETIKSNASINALWKWFVIFALVFLIIEILLLKFLK